MKFDINKKNPSITAKRTLKLLTDTLTELLEKEPFEKITIIKICEKSMIPRATFYNYFDDKYDFLNYYWSQHLLVILPHDTKKSTNVTEYLITTLENLVKYLQNNFDTSKNIYENNQNGQFFLSLHNYISKQTSDMLEHHSKTEKDWTMPLSLEAEFLAGSVLTIGFWWFKHQDEISLNDICAYFRALTERTLQ